jgi:hypothetical protein
MNPATTTNSIDAMTSHEILGFMSPGLSTRILDEVFQEDKPLYKTVLAAVAGSKRVRPQFLEKQPRVQRHPDMITTLSRPSLEETAATLLRGWLLKKHVPLLREFLDALGLPHQDGVVETLPETMEDGKLKSAVEQLLSKYPAEEVAVYLYSFNGMNDTRWPNLDAMLRQDNRLQLGG